jgi:hypothetical protein
MNKAPQDLSIEEISKLLDSFTELKQWIATVEEYALEQSQNGVDIPNYTLGTTRSSRIWVDEHMVMGVMNKSEYIMDEYYPRSMLSVAQMEKLVGKKNFSLMLADQVTEKQGSPKLIKNK